VAYNNENMAKVAAMAANGEENKLSESS